MRTPLWILLLCALSGRGAEAASAANSFTFTLPPPVAPTSLLPGSPFGINTALHPGMPDLEGRLEAMQQAGVKWGRQDFTWRHIEKRPGEYDWAGYDALVSACRRHGILLLGDLTDHPSFHDLRTEAGVAAYTAFASAAVRHYAGQVDHWQIWNEPNLGFLGGNADQYARLLAAAGTAIHQASSQARVLAMNLAFCDVPWTRAVLEKVPLSALDVICFHPYRNPNSPEDRFDWWLLDQYVKRFHPDLTTNYPPIRMSFLEQTDTMIDMMKQFGQPKPLWVTEICFNTHIHPYGVPELREADLLVRFYVQAIASRKIDKVFWWTLRDGGDRQFDAADMVGLMRADGSPKYAYQAYAVITRRLEGKRWLRNDAFGPDVFACVFTDDATSEDTIVAWANKPYAYARINNTERGLTQYDVFGTRRVVAYDKQRTGTNPFPFGESPVYIVGPKGLKVNLRPDPGW